jgi:pilus assembly protein CpaF
MSLLKRVGGQSADKSREAPAKVAIPVRGGSDNGLPASGTSIATLAPPSQPTLVLAPLPQRETLVEARSKVQDRIIAELDPKLDLSNHAELRKEIEEAFAKALDAEGFSITRTERTRMLGQITDEIVGLGPLEPLLRDESISEVMVNGPGQVYIERAGKLELTPVSFRDDDHVMRIIDRIISPIGRRIDESSPMVDARLPDGSRVNAVIPPISLVGPVLTIRKFAASPLTADDLIRFGSATPEMFDFLRACVEARLNMFVSGGTGAGKTTMLNILSSFVSNDERIVTIEDAAELQLRQDHVVTRCRDHQPEGDGRPGEPGADRRHSCLPCQ